jgi:hypothetical protein
MVRFQIFVTANFPGIDLEESRVEDDRLDPKAHRKLDDRERKALNPDAAGHRQGCVVETTDE